jgi:ketosteroid isomerase-like protein
MSQENVELFYRAIDAFNRRDLEALLALMDDDVELVPRQVALEGESSFRRHDGVRRWWNTVFDVFPDYSIEVGEVRDLGDLMLGGIRLSGHGSGSDIPWDQAIWIMVRSRGGKCVWWGTFDTRAEAFEAVGLSEQDAHADS